MRFLFFVHHIIRQHYLNFLFVFFGIILIPYQTIYSQNKFPIPTQFKIYDSFISLSKVDVIITFNQEEHSDKSISSEIGSWYSGNWVYFFSILLLISFLYIIRKYEKNRQLQKFKLEKNNFMEGLFENAPYAVAVTDSEGKISTINEIFEIIFGYTKEELVGRKLDDFLIEDAGSEAKQDRSSYSLEEHQKVYKVCKRKSKDGKIVDVELFTTPNFVGGKQYGYLIFYNDITKRLAIESELARTFKTHRAVLDTLQDAYFEADNRGLITYCNQALAKASGYEDKSELIGKHFKGFVSKKTVRFFFENFKRLYETNKAIEPFDLEYVTKDGQVYSSEIVASPIMENDIAVGTRGIIRDISLRVKAGALLRQAKEAAEFRVNELASINNVAEKISHSLDLQDILNSACEELIRIFPIRSAEISLLNNNKNILEVLAFQSMDNLEWNNRDKILSLTNNINLERMISHKKTVVLQDFQKEKNKIGLNDASIDTEIKSLMIVPLLNRGIFIGTIGMQAKEPNYIFSKNEIELAETIASQIAAAIENARLHAQTEKALDIAEQDLEIGRQIQSGFFPTELPEIKGWDIDAYFSAARQVSGDFYDIFPIERTNYFAVVVADVCDKGVGAALFMVLLRSLIRSYSEQSKENSNVSDMLLNIATKVNRYIVDTHGQSNMFATLVFSILDPIINKLYFINGGHEAPIIVDSKGNIKLYLQPTGAAFGFSTDLSFDIGVVDFLPGDMVISFTDGLTDAKNAAGNFYTEERLKSVVKSEWHSAYSIVKYLEFDVLSHIGNHKQFDDITLVAVRRRFESEVLSHSFNYHADIANLALFREFVVDACKKMKVNEDIIERLKLAVDEVCSNIIIHGYKDLKIGCIKLSLRKLENEIVVSIEDTGHSFNPEFKETPDLSDEIDNREIGGLGIYFVKELIDEINYESLKGVNLTSLKVNI